MSLLSRLRDRVTGDTADVVVYECRACGTTLSADDDECPVCGSDQVATYRIA